MQISKEDAELAYDVELLAGSCIIFLKSLKARVDENDKEKARKDLITVNELVEELNSLKI